MRVNRYKPVIVTEQYLGKRHQRDYPEMQSDADGGYVSYVDYESKLYLLSQLRPFIDVVAFGNEHTIKMTPEESLMTLVDRACALEGYHYLQFAHIGFDIVTSDKKQLSIMDGEPMRLIANVAQPIYINERPGVDG